MRITDKHVFFWKEWPSNFKRAPFFVTLDDKTVIGKITGTPIQEFFCTEQYFMWWKAVTFKDWEIAKQILATDTPQETRRLGQRVRGYTDQVWAPIREKIMFDGNFMKYSQNPDLKAKLLNPDWADKHYVEASPYDKIWAIGISWEDPACEDPRNWKGTNLLGKCLDNVRECLLALAGNEHTRNKY